MTISATRRRDADLTREPLDTFGAPIAFTGDLMWLHALTEENAVARHVHDTVVIVFFRTGTGSHEIAGRAQALAPGDIVIVPPGAIHDLTRASNLSGWALEFSPALLRRAGHDLGGWWSHPLLRPYVDGEDRMTTGSFNVADGDRHRWDELLLGMDRELSEQQSGWTEAATAHLLLLLVEVVRALESSDVASFHTDPAVTASLGVIERHFRDDLNVASIAARVGMTPEHLTTLVRRATGRPLGRWLTDRRMAEARRLLSTTDLSVEAVGRRSGYGDAAHFSRRFRQVHAMPPGEWRAQHHCASTAHRLSELPLSFT